ATPRLSEDKVKQCVDPKLGAEYPPKAIAKLHNNTHTHTLCFVSWRWQWQWQWRFFAGFQLPWTSLYVLSLVQAQLFTISPLYLMKLFTTKKNPEFHGQSN
ncbi:hypothetical protein S245_037414, partial [Arachis hypogaea]